jgi:hypothetical protein
MFTRFTPSVCFSLLFALIACATLAAQQHVVLSQTRSATVQPANGPDPGLIKIHSNLGRNTDAYDDGISWAITGNENPLWGRGSLAMPFTPKVSAAAKEVLIALGYLGGGTNDGLISLNADANGVPGEALKTWRVGHFQQEGSCCQLVALRDQAGVLLQAGVQYWIVAGTGPHSRASYDWNFVWNDAQGKVAFLNGNTKDQWLPYHDNVAAFGVYGTTP